MAEMEIEINDVLKDIQKYQKTVNKATYLEAQKELKNNVVPLLESLAVCVKQSMDTTEEALERLLEQTDSIIQPELGSRLGEVFTLAYALADALEAAPAADDVTKARNVQLITAFRNLANEVVKEVEEVTLEDVEEEEEEGEAAPEEEDEEGEDDAEDDDSDEEE